MRELQNVLVCVDLSEYSIPTMEYGATLARGMLMDLVVINVINIRDV